jgi:hypothetical protein
MHKLKVGQMIDPRTNQEKEVTLYVQFQKSKDKRKSEIEVSKFENKRNFQKFTLYARNYPKSFEIENFHQIFGSFGSITKV